MSMHKKVIKMKSLSNFIATFAVYGCDYVVLLT